MKKVFVIVMLFMGLVFGGSDLKTILKVPGVAALNGNFRNCTVELMMSDKLFSVVYHLDENIMNSFNLVPEQFKYFLNNIILYNKKIKEYDIPESGQVANLGNSYAVIVVINGEKVFKGETGIYYNLTSDKMLEIFIPETKYNDKNGDYAGTEKIWGLMLPLSSVEKIIKVLTDIAQKDGT